MSTEKKRTEESELSAAYEAVVKQMLTIYPRAQTIRIVADGPDGKAGFPLPMTPSFDDLESAVIASLGRIRPGEWMPKKTLAADVERDTNNGAFCRLLADLAKRAVIESNTNRGYRMPQP